jgi:hypothetical protein
MARCIEKLFRFDFNPKDTCIFNKALLLLVVLNQQKQGIQNKKQPQTLPRRGNQKDKIK